MGSYESMEERVSTRRGLVCKRIHWHLALPPDPLPAMDIHSDRLLTRLDELARIGALDGGGVQRLAFSDEDLAGRNWVQAHLERLGLDIRIDAVGNLFGVWQPRVPRNEPGVMVGSHTDTVGRAGHLDGALGVVGALEVLESLMESGWRPARPLILASFVNEEGVRYMPDMMGSLYHVGDLRIDHIREAQDRDGISIGQEWERLHYTGMDTLLDVKPDTFVELHIEQGPVLESLPADIGIVTGVQGLSWYEVTVTGASNHAGTTPMHLRQDAGVVAGRLAHLIRDLPNEIGDLRLTIGSMDWHPNLVNVIPDRVRFTIDVRHPEEGRLVHAERCIESFLAAEDNVSWRSLARVAPCTFSPKVVEAVAGAVEAIGLTGHRMISGAGHDAQILSRRLHSGMIFIPSRDGISHHPDEYSTNEQIRNGVRTLLHAVKHLAS